MATFESAIIQWLESRLYTNNSLHEQAFSSKILSAILVWGFCLESFRALKCSNLAFQFEGPKIVKSGEF